MSTSTRRLSLSRKQLAGLVYLAIAIVAAGLTTAETYANVQWLSALNNLDINVTSPRFSFDILPSNYTIITVTANISNPSRIPGLVLGSVVYTVFLDPATFSPQGYAEVGTKTNAFNQPIPTQGTLNVTYAFPSFLDLSNPPEILKAYVDNQTQPLISYVQLILYFSSTYGPISNTYCYLEPSNKIQISCPPERPPNVGRIPGGGG